MHALGLALPKIYFLYNWTWRRAIEFDPVRYYLPKLHIFVFSLFFGSLSGFSGFFATCQADLTYGFGLSRDQIS